jgi:hypothetical protein
MAVVVIGGVSLSTILTLFVVPAAYAVVPGRVRTGEKAEDAPEPLPAAFPAPKPGP